MKPTVLIYHFAPERAGKVKLTAMRWKIRFQQVSPGSYGLPLAELLAGAVPRDPPEEIREETISQEMLLMAGFSAPLLNAFLQSLKKNGILVPLKAILTDSNASWDSLTLYRELQGESEALSKGVSSPHNPEPMSTQEVPAP